MNNDTTINVTKIHSDKEIFEAIIACYPGLSPNGFEPTSMRDDNSFSLNEFQAARKWLNGIQKTRVIVATKETYSYYLKHRAEEATGVYISNGHLIAAAIAEGFCFRYYGNGPNVYINANARCVKEKVEGVK